MSRNSKIILGVLGGVVVLCMCVCLGGWVALRYSGELIGRSMAINNPEEAARIAHNIVDYELPSGYQEQMAFSFGFTKVAMLAETGAFESGSAKPMFILVGEPSTGSLSGDQLRQAVSSQIQQSVNSQGTSMELVDEQAALIRGQDATLYIYEGSNEYGNDFRQVVSSLFKGKQGLVMLMIMGTKAGWDQAMVDHFINSIY